MFWKLVRWGGTIAVLLMILVAAMSVTKNQSTSHQTQGEVGIKLN